MKGGPVMVEKFAVQEKFSHLFDKLGAMINSARDAFNRHSRSSMEEMRTLIGTAAQELEAALKKLAEKKAALKK